MRWWSCLHLVLFITFVDKVVLLWMPFERRLRIFYGHQTIAPDIYNSRPCEIIFNILSIFLWLSSVSWMSWLCLPREQICSLSLRNHLPWIIYSMVCASLSLYLKQAHDSMISSPTWYIASNKDMIYLSEPSNTQNTSWIGVFFFFVEN